jgi:hypothetical protein
VLDAAQNLMRTYAAPGRIEKNLVSLWAEADPPVRGRPGARKLRSGTAEANAVAVTCRRVIEAGVNPRELMIQLSSTRARAIEIHAALTNAEVPFAPARDADSRSWTSPSSAEQSRYTWSRGCRFGRCRGRNTRRQRRLT